MAFKDLRQFMDKLEAEGELIRVKQEVDWNLEAGAIIRRSCEKKGPAALFEKLKGYPEGYRLMGDPLGGNLKRVAIAFGRPFNVPDQQIYRDLLNVYDRALTKPIKPRIVATGPCKENIFKGDEVNIYRLPAPMLHDGDGGRYIGALHSVITKDADSDWINWGCYRLMIHNRRHLGGLIGPMQHITSMLRKYEAQNKPMEFAVTIGTEPVIQAMAASSIPYGVDEADIAGAIRGEPLELVKCETVNLHVPATSEAVIEGHVIPGLRMDEGPFGEYTGYRASPRAPRLVYRISCITHRNNPIITAAVEGIPFTSSHTIMAVAWAADIRKALVAEGIPFVDINVMGETANFIVVISTEVPYPGIAHRIASIVWGCKGGQYIFKVIVVDDDVDVYNPIEVLHAFATKCHPVRGTHTVPYATGNVLTPYQNLEERLWAKGCRVLYDCTWPIDWPPEIAVPPRSSFNALYPEHIREKVLKNWKSYGFKD